jgi:hypothetical protein
LPFISFGHSPEKRNPLSLFTIEELRLFCEKNNLYYVEDNEIWLNEYKQKMISWNGNKYWLYNRWPFLHKNNSNNWYELLKWDGLSWQCEYQKFFLYDIIETTLPFQKEAGEFYSMICCSKTSLLRYEDPSRIEERQRYIKAKTYCVKNRCWYKSVINDTPPYWYVNGLVKV